MSKRLLPIMTANGSFGNLRRGGYVYVDKTAYLHSLVRQEGNMLVPPIGSKHGMSGPCHKMRYSFSSDTNNRNCIDVKWTPHLRSP